MKSANLYCQWNDYLPALCFYRLYFRWLMSPNSVMKQNDNTEQEIDTGKCEGTRESILLSDIDGDFIDHQQEVLLLCQVHQNMSLQSTNIQQSEKGIHTNTLIAHPHFRNSQNPAVDTLPPKFRLQWSMLLNELCKSDLASPIHVLQLSKSTRDLHVSQPKASGDYNGPQYCKATFEVMKMSLAVMVFTMTVWPIRSDKMYSIVKWA